MAEEVTKLSLAVDSAQVKAAGSELDKFAASGKKAETAAAGLEKGSKGVGSAMAGIETATLRVQSAQAALASAIARVGTAQEAFNRTLRAGPAIQSEMVAGAARIQSAQAAQAQASARLAAAQALLSASTKSVGTVQGITAIQSQQLSFQLHDLFVQIAAGQNPLQAFIQQGSQLSGTFGGVGGTLRALGTVFTATRLAIGGLAGAALGLAFAFERGQEQSLAFQRAIILTGNAAGVTEGQFNEMAATIAQTTNTTIGSARETLQSLVASGRFSGDALRSAALAVQTLAKATGQSREDIIRDFVRAADGPTKFAEQTNRALNFLTAQQLSYIRTLEDQGRTQEALAVTFEALNQRTGEAATKVGLLERAWQGVKNAVSGAADALLAFGRDKTTEEKIAALRAELQGLNEIRSPEEQSSGASAERAAQIELEIIALQKLVQVQREAATQQAETAQTNQARIAFDKLREQTMTRQARLAKELADANAIADRAGATAAERAAVLAGIREKFAALDSDVNAVAKAKLQADLDAIQQALKTRNDAVRNAQSVFNALRQAGALDDADAFAAQRAQIRLQAAFEVQALEDENRRREQQRFTGKEALRLIIDNNAKIAANLQQIARIRGDTAAAERAVDIQQEAAAKRRIASFQAERLSLKALFQSMQRQFELEEALFGRGDEFARAARERAGVAERFRQEIERANADIQTKRTAGTATADDEREFEARIGLLNEFLNKSLALYDANFAKVKKSQGDFNAGAKKGFEEYADNAINSNRLAFEFVTGGLRSLEDALVTFVTTGKLSFKSLADFIVIELTRVIIKQQLIKPLAELLGNNTGSGGQGSSGLIMSFIGSLFAGGRAQGGSVEAGKLYRVNEGAGPGELLNVGNRQYLLAAQNGSVQPQSGGVVNNNTFNVTVPNGTPRRVGQQVAAEAAGYLARANARNN